MKWQLLLGALGRPRLAQFGEVTTPNAQTDSLVQQRSIDPQAYLCAPTPIHLFLFCYYWALSGSQGALPLPGCPHLRRAQSYGLCLSLVDLPDKLLPTIDYKPSKSTPPRVVCCGGVLGISPLNFCEPACIMSFEAFVQHV